MERHLRSFAQARTPSRWVCDDGSSGAWAHGVRRRVAPKALLRAREHLVDLHFQRSSIRPRCTCIVTAAERVAAPGGGHARRRATGSAGGDRCMP